jgi:hypothetical protein
MHIAENKLVNFLVLFPSLYRWTLFFLNQTLTRPSICYSVVLQKSYKGKAETFSIISCRYSLVFAAVKILKYCDTLSTSDKLFSTLINFFYRGCWQKKITLF